MRTNPLDFIDTFSKKNSTALLGKKSIDWPNFPSNNIKKHDFLIYWQRFQSFFLNLSNY